VTTSTCEDFFNSTAFIVKNNVNVVPTIYWQNAAGVRQLAQPL